ncbi:DUF1642 domain-containing protein [Enterococcus sp. AZ172]|uniref:DUF1642 domain-containing protein n=1 Tax=unclassified Enterococcus TaxID=2608891 RepID=UPI003F290804
MKAIEDIIHELNLKCTALNTNSVTIEQTDENDEFKCNSHVSDFNKGKIEGLSEAKKLLEEVKQLDEPQRETIPKCAHEFILEGTGLGLSYFEIITSAESFANAKPQDEFSKWLRKNSGLFIRSLLDGYEVKKEPLYRVKLGEGYFVEYQGRGALIMIIPDDNKEIKIFDSKSDAERTAQTIGGTVEEVAEG